jgi:hypothetical protein
MHLFLNGACWACHSSRDLDGIRIELQFDHDHALGYIRGVLCAKCNTAVGKFGEDPHLLRKAADYIENPPIPRGVLDYDTPRKPAFAELERLQGSRGCVLCGTTESLCRDHYGNWYRGVLCHFHNLSLGESADRLRAAAEYIEQCQALVTAAGLAGAQRRARARGTKNRLAHGLLPGLKAHMRANWTNPVPFDEPKLKVAPNGAEQTLHDLVWQLIAQRVGYAGVRRSKAGVSSATQGTTFNVGFAAASRAQPWRYWLPRQHAGIAVLVIFIP